MKYRFSYQHVVLALLTTLVLAGLFYLPYLAVRNKTLDEFYTQKVLLAQQVASEIQSYFTTYEKALLYLAEQPSIQEMDESGQLLLRDFFSIHPSDIQGIHRVDREGKVVFSVTNDQDAQVASPEDQSRYCLQMKKGTMPMVTEILSLWSGGRALFLTVGIKRQEDFDGCLSFVVPFEQIIKRALKALPEDRGNSVVVYNEASQILYATNAQFIAQPLATLTRGQLDIAPMLRALESQQQKILALDYNPLSTTGDKVYAMSYAFYLPGPSKWTVLMFAPAQKVVGAMAAFRSQWLLVTGVAVATVGLMSFFLSGMLARRREEQRRRTVEEHLVDLLELAPMGVYLLDRAGQVVYANKEAVAMVDATTREAVEGQDFADFLGRHCRHQVVKQIRETSAGQAVEIESASLVSQEKRVRDIVITVTPHQLGEQGQTICIVRDVTAERKAEERRRRLATAVDQVKESVIIADRAGIIEYVNASLEEMTGYSRQECFGRPLSLLWPEEQEAQFEQQVKGLVHLDEVWRGRIVNRRKDASLFVAAVTLSPVRDTATELTHFIVIQRDITHEVEFETRMRQAQKMEAIGTLAGGIAHDFNNILGGIIGFTDMALLQCDPDSELYNNLIHIRQGGRRAADLVQQILTFSRQSAEEKVAVSMAAMIKESLKLLRATLPTTIDMTQDLTKEDVQVLAAPVQIQQIVINLCTNAFYSMREKGGQLTISLMLKTGAECGKADSCEPGERWAELKVADTGQGIESEIIPSIFTPFFTTKKPGEGTGMGLSVVHGIVRELGGEITVQSQPGVGSMFTVLLPAVSEEGTPHNLISSEEDLPTGTEHILVVDDEKEIRETCRMMLRHLGYTITTTGNPREVMMLLARSTPAIGLVITDQTMPKTTGIELTRELHRMHPQVPVILCTGYSDRLNYDVAREAGACDLLMKPVDLRGLSHAVRAALDMRQQEEGGGV